MLLYEDPTNAVDGFMKIFCKTLEDSMRLWEVMANTVVLEQLNLASSTEKLYTQEIIPL